MLDASTLTGSIHRALTKINPANPLGGEVRGGDDSR
jgi:hypothetical protein